MHGSTVSVAGMQLVRQGPCLFWCAVLAGWHKVTPQAMLRHGTWHHVNWPQGVQSVHQGAAAEPPTAGRAARRFATPHSTT
jgi:hypothetical protein